jgi:hypothetical protein
VLDGVLAKRRERPLAAAWAARREVVAWWALSRVLVLVAALSLHWTKGPRGYFGPSVFAHVLGPLQAWDGIWYRLIAQHGYLLVSGRQSDPAFFPLYPLLLKAGGLTGLPLGVVGIVLSTFLFLGALLAFDALGHELVGPDLARRATILLAVFPTTYVCSMVYPESLLLLTFALTGLFAVRRRWVLCALTAALAALARPEGALLVIPIVAAVYRAWRSAGSDERGRAVGALLAAPAAALSFPLYLGWALHDPLAWSKAQHAWGRSFRTNGIFQSFSNFAHEAGRQAWAGRDFGFCLVILALLLVAWRVGVPRGWILLGALLVLVPLGSGSFESDARFGLVALPVYWGLASLTRRPVAFAGTVAASAALLVGATLTLPLVFP